MSKKKYLTEQETKHFKMLLFEKDMTIGYVAEQIGLSRTAISNRIHGKYEFTRSDMIGFCKVTQTPILETFNLSCCEGDCNDSIK